MPYPGLFVENDLEDKILKANELLYQQYKRAGDQYGMKQCGTNAEIVKSDRYKTIDTRTWLEELSANWKILTRAATGIGIPE